jgi:uncharacterized protein (TIGR01777 family)
LPRLGTMRPDPLPTQSSLVVAVSGATGLIGTALVERLRARGHTVRRLLRSSRDLRPGDALWAPARGAPTADALAGAEAIIHLAGEPVAHRWTAARMRAIRESRVQSTMQLAQAIQTLDPKPRVVLSVSAVGYYGDRGDEPLDESSGPGDDFLATVCRDWEHAAAPVADAGVRLVVLRSGIVLSPNGGALKRLLPIFRLGGGGRLGSGRQWMSWISLDDHLRAMEHALHTESVRGPVNLVAPNSVTNAEFASTLGRVLSRPALVPVPAFAMELLYGEMARATLLAGQRVSPKMLSASAFEFAEPTLEGALRAELNGYPDAGKPG